MLQIDGGDNFSIKNPFGLPKEWVDEIKPHHWLRRIFRTKNRFKVVNLLEINDLYVCSV